MNKQLLLFTQRNLMDWLIKSREQTVTTDEKIEILMCSLADMCQALSEDPLKPVSKREG